MSVPRRGFGEASVFLAAVVAASVTAGAVAGACALPGYTLGDTGTSAASGGVGGAGGTNMTGGGGAGGKASGAGGAVGAGGNGGDATTGGGGAGGAMPCITNVDCEPSLDPCTKIACKANVCTPIMFPDGPYSKDDKYNVVGDCTKTTCVMGKLTYTLDASDVAMSPSSCITNDCSADGVIIHNPANNNLPCVLDPASPEGACNTIGDCVECVKPTANCVGCDGFHCINSQTCTNGIKDGDETDVGCGGSCAPCPPGKGCLVASDCITGVCEMVTHKCSQPSHTDGVRNGMESDVDCGGDPNAQCVNGKHCNGSLDCISGVCAMGACQQTCLNKVKDGAETGVDCGGTICPPCGG